MNMLIGICLFTLFVYQVSALKCYNCLTGCNDQFEAKGVSTVECTGSCTKTKSGGNVIRGCLPIVKTDNCEEKDDNAVCTCTSDNCNGANTKYTPTFVVITTFACVIFHAFRIVF